VEGIEVRKGPGGKSAYISGTRTRVSDIARLYRILQDEAVIDRICESLPHLEPAQVRAAIDWWRANGQTVEDEIAEEQALLDTIPTR
jgi:uncharacterized protein (DUF433 family)